MLGLSIYVNPSVLGVDVDLDPTNGFPVSHWFPMTEPTYRCSDGTAGCTEPSNSRVMSHL